MQIEKSFEEDKNSKASQLVSENESHFSFKSGQEVPDKLNLKTKLISLLTIFVLINIAISHSPFMQTYINQFQNYLQGYYETNTPFAIFNISFFFAFIMIFSIPVQMLYMIIITSVVKDASVLFIILYFTGLITNFSVYFFMQIPTVRKKWRKWFCNNIYFKIIKMKVDENVWLAAILARLLFIPAGVKLYVMCLLEIPPLCFVLTTLVGEAFDITEYIIIGQGVNGLRDFLDKQVWAQKTSAEKIHLYIMFGMIFFTIAFLIYIAALFKVTKPSSKNYTQKSVEFTTQTNSNSQSLTVEQKTNQVNLINYSYIYMQQNDKKFHVKDLNSKDICIDIQEGQIELKGLNQEEKIVQIKKPDFIGVQIDDYRKSFYILFTVLKKDTVYKERIIEQFKFKYDNIEQANNIKRYLLQWLYDNSPYTLKNTEDCLKQYYKKILFFVNRNSGQKKAETIFDSVKQVLEANGIYYEIVFTKKDPFVCNYITNLQKNQLLSYDCIVGISGDGTIYEIIDGYFQRQDIDFEKELITVFQLPAGSGCGLCENVLKISNGEKCLLSNALYYLCHMKKQKFPIAKFQGIKKDNTIITKYNFLNCNYGFLADVDKGSEIFRFLGAARFEVYGHLKLLFLNKYDLKIYLSSNEALPDITEQIVQQESIEILQGKYFSVLSTILPYLLKNSLCSPRLVNNLGKINMHIFPTSEGRIKFIKYLMNLDKFNPDDSKGAITKDVQSFRIQMDPKRKNIMLDGETLEDHQFVTIQKTVLPYKYYTLN